METLKSFACVMALLGSIWLLFFMASFGWYQAKLIIDYLSNITIADTE